MMLKDNHEFIADLKNVTLVDGTATFSFAIDKTVQVPASAFAETDLRSYIGDRVGIIHIGGVYRIRRVSQSSKKNLNMTKEDKKNKFNRGDKKPEKEPLEEE